MNMREASKNTWKSGNTREDINCGSLQRIADATERMAQRHTELIGERDRFQRYYRQEQAVNQRLSHRLRAAKGLQTRLRKRIGRLLDNELVALRQMRAMRVAIGFVLDSDGCIATYEFLAMWRDRRWDELDAEFPLWKAYCEKLGFDPREIPGAAA